MMSRALIFAALSAIAACAKGKSEETASSAVDETADKAEPEPASAQPEPAEKELDPRCTKFRADVSKMLGTPVTDLDYWEPINGGAMAASTARALASRRLSRSDRAETLRWSARASSREASRATRLSAATPSASNSAV